MFAPKGRGVSPFRLVEMHNFILVCTDAVTPEGARLGAETLAEARLVAHRWPLYPQTPHQGRMAPGDRLVVYLGGSRVGAQSFYAIGRIALIERSKRGRDSSSAHDHLQGHQPASSWLLLKDTQRLNPRVSVRDLLPKLSFLPKTPSRWGVAFMSGVRILSDADWRVIVARGAASAA
jgi:hypothetical protein